jgi:glyoxylase-like metal-dependent hydrolase (beta-lactamase superfamily II)
LALIRRSFPVGALGCNCTIVACPETHQGLVIDPGDEAPRILAELAGLGVTAVALVHTHAHFDHIMADGELSKATGAEILIHRDDRWLYDNVEMQAGVFGLRAPPPPRPTRELAGGEVIPFGHREARSLHTPGHTPGSICLFLEAPGERPLLFAGDTLFAGAIGRTDLWGGSSEQIIKSITGALFALPEETVVIPGHGPLTTIAAEREDNPYVGKFA